MQAPIIRKGINPYVCRVQTSDLVANLFKDCVSNVDYLGLCKSVERFLWLPNTLAAYRLAVEM
jgi:hypothetical protein